MQLSSLRGHRSTLVSMFLRGQPLFPPFCDQFCPGQGSWTCPREEWVRVRGESMGAGEEAGQMWPQCSG